MKADLTRKTFDPLKHFSQVIMQQGRVQLDADWNEQAAILLHSLRALAADLIGPQGGPAANLGFAINPYPSNSPVANDFQIGPGVYYVNGIRCEAESEAVPITVTIQGNSTQAQVDHWAIGGVPLQSGQYLEVIDDVEPPLNPAFPPALVQVTNPQPSQLTVTLQGAPNQISNATAPKLRRLLTYLAQPDYSVPDAEKLGAGTFLVYLDVWERHMTYVEDDSMREVALGGAETASRAKVVWQVKSAIGAGESCDKFTPSDQTLEQFLLGPNRGRLKARAKQTGASTDPCIIAPNATYRGPENQLYRVEIHRPGMAWNGKQDNATGATFKWSRENGSVVFPILKLATGSGVTTVTLETLGRDDRFGLKEGDWVEIQDDPYVLQNRAENLLQVQSIDRSSLTVTLTGSAGTAGKDSSAHPLLRRWDHQAGDPAQGGLTLGSDNAALLEQGVWVELENGVQILFETTSSSAKPYHTSDYWLIPARVATGNVEWPTEMDSQQKPVPLSKPPDGVAHYYAPLGVVSVDGNGKITLKSDCRKQFPALAQNR